MALKQVVRAPYFRKFSDSSISTIHPRTFIHVVPSNTTGLLDFDHYLTVSRCALIRIPAHRKYENIQDEKFIIENFLLQNIPEIQYNGCSVARDN